MTRERADQYYLPIPERVIEVPEYYHCERHGDWPWELYYDDGEMIQMIDEQGFVDCPLCLEGMADPG